MSWSFNMGGHVTDEAREREILEAAKEFARKVGQDGRGHFGGHFVGSHNLPSPYDTTADEGPGTPPTQPPPDEEPGRGPGLGGGGGD